MFARPVNETLGRCIQTTSHEAQNAFRTRPTKGGPGNPNAQRKQAPRPNALREQAPRPNPPRKRRATPPDLRPGFG